MVAGRFRESIRAVRRLFVETTRGDLLAGTAFALAGALETAGKLPYVAALFCITFRRQRPLLPLAAITAVTGALEFAQDARLLPGVGQGGVGHTSIQFGLMFATFSLGIHGNRRELAIGALLPLMLNGVVNALGQTGTPVVGGLVFTAVVFVGAPLFIGRLVRDRSRLVAELRHQEALLHAELETSAKAALAAEKLELSAQLQAILATGMDHLVAQVDLARVATEQQRPQAVGGIETTARRLLGELGQVLASISPGADASQWTSAGLRAALDRAQALAPDERRGTSVDERVRSRQQREQIQSTPRWAGARWDMWAAGAVFAALALQVQTSSQIGGPKAVAVLACFAIAAPVALVGRRPLAAAAASLTCAAIFSISLLPLNQFFTALSLFFILPLAVAACAERRRALVGLGICLVGTWAVLGLDLGVALIVIGAWWAGRMLRDRTRLASVLLETNRRLALERETNDLRVVLEERAQMAREVHDVVGHSLTVIAIQAGAARRLWDHDRLKSEAALATIAQVVEAARLDLSQASDLGAISAEAPRRLAIDDLVERAQLAGLTVGVQVHGSEVKLNPEAQLAAYRLVQEALTNVLKHVPTAAAEISLSYQENGVEVAVNNAITVIPRAGPSVGRGLRGMSERVTACGGTLKWGPNRGGEFEVTAWFPAAARAN